MNIQHKKLAFTTNFLSTKGFTDSNKNQLFMPEQIDNIKLNNLRHKRRQLQQKLKHISNRISFKRKKQQDQLKRYIRTEEKCRALSQTKNYKQINTMLKQQLNQKKVFQQKKKAKQVQQTRSTSNRRLNIIYQSIRDRKLSESQKLRQTKKMDQQMINVSRHQAMQQLKQKHQNIIKMKQRQLTKRKCYWLEKRLSFQQNIIQQSSIYQNQIKNYYKKIQELKRNQQQLRQKQQHAVQVLRCAEQNYQLLKQS